MKDNVEMVISGKDIGDLLRSYSEAMSQLSIEGKAKLRKARQIYLAQGGFDGVFNNMNNRSIRDILRATEGMEIPQSLASGEFGGSRFSLFENPDAQSS